VHVIELDQTESTSLLARAMLNNGELQGATLICARTQAGGVGRHGRRWHSPVGGLWCTLAWPVPHATGALARSNWTRTLGLRVGWACLDAIVATCGGGNAETGARTRLVLKLPNDVLIAREPDRGADGRGSSAEAGLGDKVCGVLTELVMPATTSSQAGDATTGGTPPAPGPARAQQAWCLVGVGINANVPAQELPTGLGYRATSLLAQGYGPVDLVALRARLADRLIEALEAQTLTEPMRLLIEPRLAGLGTTIEAEDAGVLIRGSLSGLGPEGDVLVLVDGEPEPRSLSPGAQVRWPVGAA